MNYARSYPRFWFWYFWLYCVLLALAFFENAVSAVSGRGSAVSLLGLTASTLSLWPLHGYIRQTRVNPRWLWKVVFVFYTGLLVLATLLVLFVVARTSSSEPLWVMIAVWSITAPLILALYQYIYRSQHVWATT